MFEIILIIIAIVVLWRVFSSYRLNTFDTVVAFTGGLGAGKSFMATEIAIKLLRRKRREVKWKNALRKKGNKLPTPLLYFVNEDHRALHKPFLQGQMFLGEDHSIFFS